MYLVVAIAIAAASTPEGMAQTFKIGAEVVEVKKLRSGGAQTMTVDRNRNIYVGMRSLYISRDSGKSWIESIEARQRFGTCWSLLSIDSGYILAGTDDGVLRSKDYGMTWERVFWPPPYGSGSSLLLSKAGSVFVGTHNNIFRSTDNGNHWGKVADSTVVNRYVWAFGQTPDGTLIAGCSSGITNGANGVLISTDDGTTWKRTSNNGLIDKNIAGVAGYDGGFSQAIFLSTELGGNYISTDKGLSWKMLPIDNRFGSRVFTCSPLGAFIGCRFPDNAGFALYRQYGASAWVGVPGITDGVWAIAQWEINSLLVQTTSGLYLVSFYNPTKVEDSPVPDDFRLEQNYPNPFNPSTTIRFSLPSRTNVDLKVFNTIGQAVETIVQSELNSGTHQYVWNAEKYPSGIYFYRLETSTGFRAARKMLLVK
jgi:photosystem II stability/assembly factor-like uncharacterized protein